MKNKKIILIALTILLSLPITGWAVDDYSSTQDNEFQREEVIVEESDTGINQVEDYSTVQEQEEMKAMPVAQKQPVSRKKLAKKFILAMLGVAISTMMIYAVLTLYNRIRDGVINNINTPNRGTSLQAPNDLTSAIKTFLNKTNW